MPQPSKTHCWMHCPLSWRISSRMMLAEIWLLLHLMRKLFNLYDSVSIENLSPYHDLFASYREIPPRPFTAANQQSFDARRVPDCWYMVYILFVFRSLIQPLHTNTYKYAVVSRPDIVLCSRQVLAPCLLSPITCSFKCAVRNGCRITDSQCEPLHLIILGLLSKVFFAPP